MPDTVTPKASLGVLYKPRKSRAAQRTPSALDWGVRNVLRARKMMGNILFLMVGIIGLALDACVGMIFISIQEVRLDYKVVFRYGSALEGGDNKCES